MAELLYQLQQDGIYKKIIYGGEGDLPEIPDGAKATFHYRTLKTNEEQTVLDDSKHIGKPMELIFGKKFKLEVWEKLLKTMKIKEVAEFTCDIKHTAVYPLVAKSLRDIFKGKSSHEHTSHCCGMMALSEQGMGYSDLDELMKCPQPLIFILEFNKLELPEQFEPESWSMNGSEKLESIPKLREAGNEAYSKKDYEDAAKKYAQALGLLEDLMLHEKPGDEEWNKLDEMKRPLLLNFSQCKLLTHDYYPVITHTSDVLIKDPDNVKALFRRGKAHAAVWNLKEAQEDFAHVLELEPSLKKAVNVELASLEKRVKEKEKQEKSLLQGMFS
ncbi:AH receptor-interacting protein [Biomphalaria pfeifferi]|uniref:AH receptor-interacting protein n=1 Tax=Biomphalaria pfeifferi TaxID=112525 RepID=A0AAD8FMU1_BIOPF|nr:AH receptor-interacting protein [Biomphalaria pfeifferi]